MEIRFSDGNYKVLTSKLKWPLCCFIRVVCGLPVVVTHVFVLQIPVWFIDYVDIRDYWDNSHVNWQPWYCLSFCSSVWLCIQNHPSAVSQLFRHRFSNQSVNVLENIHVKQNVSPLVQFSLFTEIDLKWTEGNWQRSLVWPVPRQAQLFPSG
jgi:hypothetical protein